jgi:hypothetical protein
MRKREWGAGPCLAGDEGGHYRDIYYSGTDNVVATVPQDYPADDRNLALILEAPEAVKACLYMMKVMRDYGPSVIHDLFENNEHWDKAERLFTQVAKSYLRRVRK